MPDNINDSNTVEENNEKENSVLSTTESFPSLFGSSSTSDTIVGPIQSDISYPVTKNTTSKNT